MYRLNDTYLLADNKIVRTNGIHCPLSFSSFLPFGRKRLLSQQAPSRVRLLNYSPVRLSHRCRASHGHRRCEYWRHTPVKRMHGRVPIRESILIMFTSVSDPLDVSIGKDANDKRGRAVLNDGKYQYVLPVLSQLSYCRVNSYEYL